MLRRFRLVVFGAVALLNLALTLMTVPVAHAAPKPTNGTESLCTAVATRTSNWDIAWSGSGYGHYSTRANVQEKANSDGSGCGIFRVKISIWAQSGYQYYGTYGVLKKPGGGNVSGGSFNDSTVYTGASSWRDFYGPWTSATGCSDGIYGYGGSFRYNPVDGSSGQGGGLTFYC